MLSLGKPGYIKSVIKEFSFSLNIFFLYVVGFPQDPCPIRHNLGQGAGTRKSCSLCPLSLLDGGRRSPGNKKAGSSQQPAVMPGSSQHLLLGEGEELTHQGYFFEIIHH